jgi:hypothetical protein
MERLERQFEPGFETKSEGKEQFGKEVEWTIALPLLEDLKKEGVFLEVYHTSKEVDEKKGIDFVVCLPDGSHLAVQSSINEDREVWQKKAKKILESPLVELKEIHPKSNFLSRKERLEETPKVLWKLSSGSVEVAYFDFAKFGRNGRPFDYLSDKRELQKALLIQVMANLRHFFQDNDLANRFSRLPQIARERNHVLNEQALRLVKSERE